MKKMFSAKKVQMLTLMLLCGTTAVMAQNSAGVIPPVRLHWLP